MATEEVKIKALLENDKQYFPATRWKAINGYLMQAVVILMDCLKTVSFG